MRWLATVALMSTPAFADEVPGTQDDPVLALGVAPTVTDAPLVPALSMRGSETANTRVLFDGFEVPWLFHEPWRSIVAPGVIDVAIAPGHFGVEHGHATNLVELDSSRMQGNHVGLTPVDA